MERSWIKTSLDWLPEPPEPESHILHWPIIQGWGTWCTWKQEWSSFLLSFLPSHSINQPIYHVMCVHQPHTGHHTARQGYSGKAGRLFRKLAFWWGRGRIGSERICQQEMLSAVKRCWWPPRQTLEQCART